MDLLGLRKSQLTLRRSPLVAEAPTRAASAPLAEVTDNPMAGAALVGRAIEEHAPQDWFATPAALRPGPWGDEPTLARLVGPLDDFTNHRGAVRAIRRMRGNPAPRTQKGYGSFCNIH